MDERTREFLNIVQSVNDEARRLGYKNGRDWAENAGMLGGSDAGGFVSCHYLRTAVAHGRAMDVRVTQETLDFVNAVLLTIQATSQASNASKYRVSFLQKLFGKKKDDLPDAEMPLEVDERTREFLNVVQSVNDEARRLGHKNGRDWAENAGVLSASDAGNYVSCHYLRNAAMHGRAKDVHVSQETLDFVQEILKAIQAAGQTAGASKPRTSFFQNLFDKKKDNPPAAEPAKVPSKPEPKPEPQPGTREWYLYAMQLINDEARYQGYKNGCDWAENAGVLSASDAGKFVCAHHLRNTIAGGRSMDFHVSQETLDFVQDILHKIQAAGQNADAAEPRVSSSHELVNEKKTDLPAAEPAEVPPKPESKPELKPGTLEWYLQKAEKGDASAQFELGRRYLSGEGIAEDKAEAMKWYSKAAEQGNADAQCGLGLLYRDRDPQEEVKWLLLAAKQGQEDAQIALCVKKTGVDVPEDSDLEKVYIAQAEKGDSHEMYCLGRCYLEGLSGIPKNLTKAEEWLTKAAELGHPDAQHAMGNFYRVEDEKEAQKWYHKAAEQGHAQAQIDLAQLHSEGDMYDEKESQKWLIKAAKQGDRTALNLLADYETDEDALDGDDTLEERYIAEARAGAPGAMYELGYNYLYGCGGVRKNLEKAVQWLTVAAEQGDGDAMYELGCCYENGWGVDQDEDEARQWYWEAYVQGSDEAEMRLKELRKEEDEED